MNKKFIAMAAAMATFTCVAITASAAVYEDNTLVYNAASSNETTKVIDVYCAGDITYGGALEFKVEGATIVNYSLSAPEFDAPTVRGDWTDVANGQIGWGVVTKSGDTMDFAGAPFATLTLTVPEGTGEFTVKLTGDTAIGDADWNEEVIAEDIVVTIPAYTTGGGSTEVPAGEGQTFVDYKDPHVKVFTANLGETDYSGKTISWVLTRTSDGKLSKPIAAKTDFSGGLDVTLGLKIVGDISDIASAKLVIE